MKRYLHMAIGVVFLAGSIAAGPLAAQGADEQDAGQSASSLPPIFVPGNKIEAISRTLIITWTVEEVHGEWVLVSEAGQKPGWIRPASMDATFRLAQ